MTNMKLIFLGTSSAVPTARRCLSSLVIVRGSEVLLFDAGEGMQRNFMQAGIGMNKKMKIFISHMHSDHCIGLLGLLQTMALQGREKAVDIFGEPRVTEFIKENMRIINFGLTFDVAIHTIVKEGTVVRESDYQVSCCKAMHSILSYAYLLEEFDRPGVFDVKKAKKLGIPEGELYGKLQHGKDIILHGKKIRSKQIIGPQRKGRKIGISGDTRPTKQLEKFFHGSDILIFESTYSQDKHQKAVENWHSTSEEAAMLARKAKIGKLFLTHFSARYDETSTLVHEARAIHRNVEAAEDLKSVEVPYG